MPTNVLTRRTALFSLAAVASVGLSGCNTTPTAGVQPGAASGFHVGAIEVDTTPLVVYVGNPTAGWAQQALPGAPPLHVRIDTLYLGGGGPADPDRIRGGAMLGGRTISVRATSTYFSSPTDQALPEHALQSRVQALTFACRLKRKMGA
jgi:hypothetical protein